jgi:mannose-6-phosphate isomerase-like protein (cupin superfamily)
MRLSLQSHNHRCEHWVIVSGSGLVHLQPEQESVAGSSNPVLQSITVQSKQHVWVPIRARHRITNTSQSQDLVFIETQLGDQLEEDDIIRYQDDFGRV